MHKTLQKSLYDGLKKWTSLMLNFQYQKNCNCEFYLPKNIFFFEKCEPQLAQIQENKKKYI